MGRGTMSMEEGFQCTLHKFSILDASRNILVEFNDQGSWRGSYRSNDDLNIVEFLFFKGILSS